MTTSDMATPTATAQVFALPELLEHILIQIGLDSYDQDSEWQEPARQLFVLQRVNGTFHAIIAKSLRPRSLICLAKNSAYHQYAHAAMKWLLRQIYGKRPVFERNIGKADVNGKHALIPTSTTNTAKLHWYYRQMNFHFGLGDPGPQPSWGRMVVAPAWIHVELRTIDIKEGVKLKAVIDRFEGYPKWV